MKKPKGFFTYFHHSSVVEKLSDEQAGRLYKSLLKYGDTGELSDFADDQTLDIVYDVLKAEIDVNFERYNEISRKRSEAAQKGVESRREKFDQQLRAIADKC